MAATAAATSIADNRLIATGNPECPIRNSWIRVNVTYKELNDLVEAVLQNGESSTREHAELAQRVARYIRNQPEGSHFYRSLLPLIAKCNQCCRNYISKTFPRDAVAVYCVDGPLLIDYGAHRILSAESFYYSQNPDTLPISQTIMTKIIHKLCDGNLFETSPNFEEYMECVFASCVLSIPTLQDFFSKNSIRDLVLPPDNEELMRIVNSIGKKSEDLGLFENKTIKTVLKRLVEEYFNTKHESFIEVLNAWHIESFTFGSLEFNRYNAARPAHTKLVDLSQANHLRHVTLQCYHLTEGVWNNLASIPNLRSLTFIACDFSSNGILLEDQILRFPNLESFEISVPIEGDQESTTVYTEQLFIHLGLIPTLKKIKFTKGNLIRSEWLRHLQSLHLEYFKLNRIFEFDGEGLKWLNSEKLMTLKLEYVKLSSLAIDVLKNFSALRHLSLFGFTNSREDESKALSLLPGYSSLHKVNFLHTNSDPNCLFNQLPKSVEVVKQSYCSDYPVPSRPSLSTVLRVARLFQYYCEGRMITQSDLEEMHNLISKASS